MMSTRINTVSYVQNGGEIACNFQSNVFGYKSLKFVPMAPANNKSSPWDTWWHQAITWTNCDLSLMVFYGIDFEINLKKISIHKSSWRITLLKSHSDLLRAG